MVTKLEEGTAYFEVSGIVERICSFFYVFYSTTLFYGGSEEATGYCWVYSWETYCWETVGYVYG